MKNTKTNKYTHLIFGLIIFGLIIFINSIIKNNKNKSLIQFAKLTSGELSAFPQGGKSRFTGVTFRLNIHEMEYIIVQGSTNKNFEENNVKKKFIGKYFPVIYDSTNPYNSYMLIDSEDFKKYGVPFPDSLDWVRTYFR